MRLPSFQTCFFFRTNPKVSERGLGWSGGVGVRHVIVFFQRVSSWVQISSVWKGGGKKTMLLLQFIRLVDTVNLPCFFLVFFKRVFGAWKTFRKTPTLWNEPLLLGVIVTKTPEFVRCAFLVSAF